MAGYRGPGTGDGPTSYVGLRTGVWYIPAGLAVWRPNTNTTDRILSPIGNANSIPWDATTGGWAAAVWYGVSEDAAVHYIFSDTNLAGTRGWSLRKTATAGQLILRVYTGAGAAAETTITGAVAGQLNVVLIELDIAGAIRAITLNNGTRTTGAQAGYTIPSNAADRLGIAGRSDNTGTTLGPTGAVHCVVGRTGTLIDATQRATFWSTYAKLPNFGEFGQPAGGVSTATNPAADHKWTAHNLTDVIGGIVAAKQGTVLNEFVAPVYAF